MAAFTVIGSNWAQVFPFRPTYQLHDPEREEEKQQGTLEKTSSVTQVNLCHWSRRDLPGLKNTVLVVLPLISVRPPHCSESLRFNAFPSSVTVMSHVTQVVFLSLLP